MPSIALYTTSSTENYYYIEIRKYRYQVPQWPVLQFKFAQNQSGPERNFTMHYDKPHIDGLDHSLPCKRS